MQENPSVSEIEARPTAAGPARRRVLMWCPEALVGPHLLVMVVVARILADLGHEPLFPYCDRLFTRCVPKDSCALPPGSPAELHEQVCTQCIQTCHGVLGSTSLGAFRLGDIVTEENRDRARQIVATLADEDLPGFVYDGVAIGSLCRHDLALALKLLFEAPLGPEHYLYLREYLPTPLSIYIGMTENLSGAGFTDIIQYGQYAPNMAAFFAARKLGMGTRLVSSIDHLGVDRRRVYIFQGQTHHMLGELVAAWPTGRDRPLPEDLVREIGNDILARFGSFGASTYSIAKTSDTDLHQTLGLDRGRKLVVIFTSSLDEYQAKDMLAKATGYVASSDPRPFDTQIEWLTFLAKAVAGRRDLQVVVRVHPREDSNKRDKVTSRHLALLRANLVDLPDNFKVVWPTDPVSSYDLLEIADQVQTWGSTIGLEAARIGIPVLKLNNGDVNQPEGDFVYAVDSAEHYLRLMDEALDWPPDFGRLIHAWRFYAFSRFTGSIDLRDAVPDPGMRALPPFVRPAHAGQLADALFTPDWTWTVNHAAEGPEFRPAPEIEAAAIRRQLERILHFLMTGTDDPAAMPRRVEGGAAALTPDSPEGSFALEGNRCRYVWGGRVLERRTVACGRLAALAL
jgi:hypothetical protein